MAKTLAKNASELYDILEEKYKERFSGDPLKSMLGRIEGILDSKKIAISFVGNQFLLVSTAASTKDVLDELKPLLTSIMGESKPICSYDLQTNDIDEKDAMPTIEWDIVDPEKRIKEIVNGRAFSDETKILNLELYNEKNISDYLESEEEKEERIKNARIYGIDPGSIKDVEKINNLSEVDLYFAIDALGAYIWRCNHDAAHGRIEPVDLTEEQYAIEYLVYQTTKFGVELDEPAIDKHITSTPSYEAWYSFYSNHFKHTLTNEEWNAFQLAQRSGQDLTEFMPNGSWTDLLEKPAQKTNTNTVKKDTE